MRCRGRVRRALPTEGKEKAKQFGCKFLETSAKAKINVDEAFHELVREIRRYHKENQPNSDAKKSKGLKRFKCTVM